jgi:GTP cyclohydrolase I
VPERPDLDRAARAIEEFLDAVGAPVGQDPELEGSGAKVAEAFGHDLLAGYRMDPATILGETTATRAPGLVVLTDVPTTAVCPHHLMPAEGVVHLGYLSRAHVVGFGALGRLVDCFARRLILQEALTQSIADALVEHLGARGAGCVADLTPSCITARGGRRHGAQAVTTAFAGEMQQDAAMRRELLQHLPTRPGR